MGKNAGAFCEASEWQGAASQPNRLAAGVRRCGRRRRLRAIGDESPVILVSEYAIPVSR